MEHRIKNYEQLATDTYRKDALDIAETGLEAISTESIINNSIKIDGDYLHVNDEIFKLSDYQSIKVIGFGKASSKAARALEKILGNRITMGIVIDKEPNTCEMIKVYRGTHPRPSLENFDVSKDIVALAENSNEKDLVIVIVSGGGSALLCWPEAECLRGQELYDALLFIEERYGTNHIIVMEGLANFATYPTTRNHAVAILESNLQGGNIYTLKQFFTDTCEAKQRLNDHLFFSSFVVAPAPLSCPFLHEIYNRGYHVYAFDNLNEIKELSDAAFVPDFAARERALRSYLAAGNPYAKTAQLQLAQTVFAQGRMDEAEALLQDLLKKDPQYPYHQQTYYYLARIAYEQGNDDKAMSLLYMSLAYREDLPAKYLLSKIQANEEARKGALGREE